MRCTSVDDVSIVAEKAVNEKSDMVKYSLSKYLVVLRCTPGK